MQLFILDRDPALAAQFLADIHLRKMSLETAQILSAVLVNRKIVRPEFLPKAYNPAHPVIKAVNTPFKINWVLEYNSALHQEYLRRFSKPHAYGQWVMLYRKLLYVDTPGHAELSFAGIFKDFTPVSEDIVQAYREYYRFKKSIIHNWKYTNAGEPEWLTNNITAEECRRCGQIAPEKCRNNS